MRVFNRLSKQVAGRRSGHARGRMGLPAMVNNLLAYCLQVDSFLRDKFAEPADGGPVDRVVEEVLEAGENLREDAKRWLSGE